MNFHLNNLILHFINNYYLTSKNNIFIHKIYIKNSFQSFLFLSKNFKIKNFIFKNFLNNVIIFKNNFIYPDRFSSQNITIKIEGSYFNKTNSPNKGGAIETNSIHTLIINQCIFQNQYSSSLGGAIYHLGQFFFLTKTCFRLCRFTSGNI